MAKMRTRGSYGNTQDQPGLRLEKVGPRESALSYLEHLCVLMLMLTHIYFNLMR